ncbi:MAG TPA: hypothetical protein VIA64_00490 [Burkholderiales bacterium]
MKKLGAAETAAAEIALSIPETRIMHCCIEYAMPRTAARSGL